MIVSALHRGRPRAGLTLLEVVLAVGLLAIGMGAILGLLSFGAGVAVEAERRAAALGAWPAVRADLEERFFRLDESGRVVPPPGPLIRPVPGHPDLEYRAEGEPLEVRREDELWRIDVAIEWQSRSVRHETRMQTLLPRAVPLGERLRRQLLGDSETPGATR